MAEVQDEEQWLYGDDKGDSNTPEKEDKSESTSSEAQQPQIENEDSSNTNQDIPSTEAPETNGEVVEATESEKEPDDRNEESQDAEQNGEKAKEDGGDDSSSDDEPTVTIGKIVKQPDIMRPPPPTHRAAPTSGLKDEDFNNVGKINGVPVTDFNLAELEEKPWRKPGADLSDYFNYGFTEETWIKYCERQKSMRVNESGIGLAGLGVNIGKGMLGSSNIPVSIVNENSKYGGIGLRKPAGVPIVKPMEEITPPPMSNTQPVNTIQVMTADRRSYSNKVLAGSGSGPGYDDMDFGGNPYGNDYFNTPPPSNYYNPPPPGPWGTIPNIPPPGWGPDTLGPPPVMSHHRGSNYFEEDSMGSTGAFPVVRIKEEKDLDKVRETRESRSRSREREREREREPRHHSSRRRSRSRSKSRHKKRSRSRSRSPSHRHKRKRSKRERELDN